MGKKRRGKRLLAPGLKGAAAAMDAWARAPKLAAMSDEMLREWGVEDAEVRASVIEQVAQRMAPGRSLPGRPVAAATSKCGYAECRKALAPPLLWCSRCKAEFYCCKACQVAWTLQPPPRTERRARFGSRTHPHACSLPPFPPVHRAARR